MSARKIFISYVRKDSAALARRLREDLAPRGFSLWLDTANLSAGMDWAGAIEEAIDQCDCMLALISQGSRASQMCRAEQMRALRMNKRVLPLIVQRSSDPPLYLEHLQRLEFWANENYEKHFRTLLDSLDKVDFCPLPQKYRRTYVTVPPFPSPLVYRPEELARVRSALVRDEQSANAGIIALRGMGGVGKSVLAQMLARDEMLQAAFPDGVIWVRLGRTAGDLLPKLSEAGRALGDTTEDYPNTVAASNRVRSALSEKAVLLILDDAWSVRDVELFRPEGLLSRVLVTTRDGRLATDLGAETLALGVLKPDEAFDLLKKWAGHSSEFRPDLASRVVNECGRLPFSLAVCGAMLRDGELWSDVIDLLQNAELQVVERELAGFEYPSVLKCLQASLDGLSRSNPSAVDRYLELAAFSTASIPNQAIETLWQHTARLTARETRMLLVTLEKKSLIERVEGASSPNLVTLHDHLRDYFRFKIPDRKPLHASILDAYWTRSPRGWPSGPNDGYFFERLPGHLAGAGRYRELLALLTDVRWIGAKLAACRNVAGIISDYDLLPSDENLTKLKFVLAQASHVLIRKPDQLVSQILARLPEALSTLSHATQDGKGYWLKPQGASLANDVRVDLVLDVPGGGVTGVSPSWQGVHAALFCSNSTIWLYDSQTNVLHPLVADSLEGRVTSVVLSASGMVFAGTDRGDIFQWEKPKDSAPVRKIRLGSPVTSLAIADLGQTLCVAFTGPTIEIRDAGSLDLKFALGGHQHTVTGMVAAQERGRLVSASEDGSVRIWDLKTGRQEFVLEDLNRRVTGIALSRDGQAIALGSDEGVIALLEVPTGYIRELGRHLSRVSALSFTGDDRFVISGSYDRTVQLWNRQPRMGPEQVLRGHSSRITGVLSFDWEGRPKVASASLDGTIRIWDLGQRSESYPEGEGAGRIVGLSCWDEKVRIIRATGSLQSRAISDGKVEDLSLGDPIRGVSFEPRGSRALIWRRSNTAELWDFGISRLLKTYRTETPVTSAVFLPQGGVAFGCHDGSILFWTHGEKDPRVIRWSVSRAVYLLRHLSLPEAFLATSWDGVLRKVRASSGAVIAEAEHPLATRITALAVSNSGTQIASGSDSGAVAIWSPDLGLQQAADCGDGPVNDIVFVEGHNMVAAACDRSIAVLDAVDLKVLASLDVDQRALRCVTASVAPITLVAGDAGGGVHVLTLHGGLSLR